MGSFVNLIAPIGIGVLMIALMVIPENKRRKKFQSMLDNLKVNDRVITRGGMLAKVISINDEKNEVVLETLPDKTRMTFLKNSIASVTTESIEKNSSDNKSDKSGDK